MKFRLKTTKFKRYHIDVASQLYRTRNSTFMFSPNLYSSEQKKNLQYYCIRDIRGLTNRQGHIFLFITIQVQIPTVYMYLYCSSDNILVCCRYGECNCDNTYEIICWYSILQRWHYTRLIRKNILRIGWWERYEIVKWRWEAQQYIHRLYSFRRINYKKQLLYILNGQEYWPTNYTELFQLHNWRR